MPCTESSLSLALRCWLAQSARCRWAPFSFARLKRKRRQIAARGLLLCSTCLIGVVCAEGVAIGVRHRQVHAARMPASDPELPTRLAENHSGEMTIVVLGESSAAGVPYERRLSVGAIVAWQLGEVFAGRRFCGSCWRDRATHSRDNIANSLRCDAGRTW